MKIFSTFSPVSNREEVLTTTEPSLKKSSAQACSLFVQSGWYEPREDPRIYPSIIQLEDMISEIDRNIKSALSDCSRRAEALRNDFPGSDGRRCHQNKSRTNLNILYTRMLSCVVLPVSSSLWESGEWVANDFQILKDRCSRIGGYERVTEQHHRNAVEFLESDEGKGALMAGLNARLELINNHPFYNRHTFSGRRGGNFEAWKLAELEVIERQKSSLVTYTKREVRIELLELRQTPALRSQASGNSTVVLGLVSGGVSGEEGASSRGSSETLPSGDGGMEEPLVGHGSPAPGAGWFGGGKSFSRMMKSPVSMARPLIPSLIFYAHCTVALIPCRLFGLSLSLRILVSPLLITHLYHFALRLAFPASPLDIEADGLIDMSTVKI